MIGEFNTERKRGEEGGREGERRGRREGGREGGKEGGRGQLSLSSSMTNTLT